MTPSLPPSPSLKHLRHEAKALHKAHQARDVGACETLRHLKRFAGASDEEILAADVPLKEVQFALAMTYGFASWKAMKDHVESLAEAAPEAAGEGAEARFLLLEWESQQQMNWAVRLTLDAGRFDRIVAQGHDAAFVDTLTIGEDSRTLTIEADTSWAQGGAVVALDGPTRGAVAVEIADPYVGDRTTDRSLDLAHLARRVEQIQVVSVEWPIRNCFFRMTAIPRIVERGRTVLAALGGGRHACLETLQQCADRAEAKTDRNKFLLRAAAAAGGGCNHGPLQPDGWDRAIELYQRVIDDNPDTTLAVNARWAQASCQGCWSPQAGCDATGIGKGDWAGASAIYDELYRDVNHPGGKAAALRRKAEVQAFKADDLPGALATCGELIRAFPVQPPPSGQWTYRTCVPHGDTRSLVQSIFKYLAEQVPDVEQAQAMFDDAFGSLADDPRFGALTALFRDAVRPPAAAPAPAPAPETLPAGPAPDTETIPLPPLVSEGACVIRHESGFVRLTSLADDETWAMTTEEVATPVRIRIRARTDSTNIRIRYWCGFVIFNWEVDINLLIIGDMFNMGDENEHHVPGKGYLTENHWHDIVWEIDTGQMRVFADNEPVYTQDGDFSGLKSAVSIGPGWGSTVDVASLIVEPL